MAGNFHERYSAAEEVPLPSERSTGLVFAAVALIVAYFWRANSTVLIPALAVAAAFVATSLLAPHLLKPLNVAWFRLALLLNKIVSPIVMFVLFLIAIVPFGLVMQLRADPLRKRRSGATSYWIDKKTDSVPTSMTNQF